MVFSRPCSAEMYLHRRVAPAGRGCSPRQLQRVKLLVGIFKSNIDTLTWGMPDPETRGPTSAILWQQNGRSVVGGEAIVD